MKIELELPDWTEERHIRIFAGIELAAIKKAEEDFFRVKDGRCIQCGICCTNLKNHSLPTIDGTCIHLVDEPGREGMKRCNIALYRPRNCGNNPRSSKCKNITYKIVKCK